MKIILVNDKGEVEIVKCRKIERSHLNQRNLIIDEGERIIDISDVDRIVEG